MSLTLDRLKEILHYDPATGYWHWLMTLSNRAIAGNEAGSLRVRGDITIRVEGIEYKSHRLAWFYMTGEWPKDQIDHKDLVRSHNWWTNLRLANNSQNNANRRVRSDSSTGVKGVIRNPRSKINPYHARIRVGGKVKILGQFATIEAASDAYAIAAERVFGEFARAG